MRKFQIEIDPGVEVAKCKVIDLDTGHQNIVLGFGMEELFLLLGRKVEQRLKETEWKQWTP